MLRDDSAEPSDDEEADDERPAPPPLARLYGEKPPAPAWFDAAIADTPERTMVPVQGAGIELLTWGRRGDPGLLLLHGNSAHADWYAFIAPLVARQGFRVAAMSMSGMGGSGWREAYAMAQWSAEAEAAAEAAGLFDATVKPWFVAHSFGGFVAMMASAQWGARLAGTMIIDVPLRTPDQQAEREQRRREQRPRPHRVYLSVEEAVCRFRFMPPQRCEHLYIVDHIARTSLKAVPGGVSWRFDPMLFQNFTFGRPHRELAAALCPVVLVRGARSKLVTPAMMDYLLTLAPDGTPTAEVPDADHHVMVDNPLGLVELLLRSLKGSVSG